MPEVHDQQPPPWTGVPIERDPGTGKLLRGDPTGRTDKGRSDRGRADRWRPWKGAVLATCMVAVLAVTVWFFTTRVGGEPDPAAASNSAALPSTALVRPPDSTEAGSTVARDHRAHDHGTHGEPVPDSSVHDNPTSSAAATATAAVGAHRDRGRSDLYPVDLDGRIDERNELRDQQ